MQTFMIPGTIFMSLLAGALFGVVRGLFLVVFNATAGASSCYFLSKLIGRPIVNWLWPEKLRFFQAEVSCSSVPLVIFIFICSVSTFYKLLYFVLAASDFTNSYLWHLTNVTSLVSDSKAKREVAQLHALFESYSNIAKPVYQFGITNSGYTISYFLPGNSYWSHSGLLHYC